MMPIPVDQIVSRDFTERTLLCVIVVFSFPAKPRHNVRTSEMRLHFNPRLEQSTHRCLSHNSSPFDCHLKNNYTFVAARLRFGGLVRILSFLDIFREHMISSLLTFRLTILEATVNTFLYSVALRCNAKLATLWLQIFDGCN